MQVHEVNLSDVFEAAASFMKIRHEAAIDPEMLKKNLTATYVQEDFEDDYWVFDLD